jgi:anaerobic magnesium-protoporphyrin IX monomethyl ester cyclase
MHARRVILVNPPYERIAPGYEFVRHLANRSPSLGLLHLAAELRRAGYEPAIIESDALRLSVADVAARAIAARPAAVGLTLFTVGVASAAAIAHRIRLALPATRIIVGGPHVSSMGRETMERYHDFDYAVVGEGEQTLVELIAALEHGTPPAAVPGILFRAGTEVVATPPRATGRSLDELALPAWDLLPDFPHAYVPAVYDFPRGPVATIAASRGCPFHCRFCDTSTFGARVRHYSPQKVFDMMRHLREHHGVRHVMFVDDLFLASRQRVTELCRLLIESDLRPTWSCTARVDTVKPDLLDLMRRAGCWEISFGLETGSDELLRRMDKSAHVALAEQAVNWTTAAGIRTKGLFMLGYPGENADSIRRTKEFVRRIPMTIMNLSKFTPYPGSPVYRDLFGTAIRDDHWDRMNGMNFVWTPEGMTTAQLDREYRSILLAFYRRPRIGWYYLKLSLRNPNHVARLMRFGLGFLAARLRAWFSASPETPVPEEPATSSRVLP